MVEKFITILRDIKATKGDVCLFALLKMDEFTDKWTVVLSAPWATEGDAETFKYVLRKIRDSLAPEEVGTIARISIFAPTDHLITDLTEKYRSGAIIKDTRANGNQIHFGHIIESNIQTREGGAHQTE